VRHVGSQVRGLQILIFTLLVLFDWVGGGAAQTVPTRSTGWFWSAGAVRQAGPDGELFKGVRVLRVGYDDSCCPGFGLFWGGEQLRADRGRLGRAIGGASILLFPLSRHFSTWLYPMTGLEYLWDQPKDGLGASVGFGAEFIARPRGTSQIAVGWERYFSTVAGSRNQVTLSYRWGVMQRSVIGP
jgi:hypothetical protein